MIIKEAYIRQISENKWRVLSEKGKNLGTFPSKAKAKQRLQQVEMFKHMDKKKKRKKKSSLIHDLFKISIAEKKEPEVKYTYSYVMRKLRKNNSEKDIEDFQQIFKKQFDIALEKGLSNPENIALISALKAIDFKD